MLNDLALFLALEQWDGDRWGITCHAECGDSPAIPQGTGTRLSL
jgi:hypothetical protein